MSDETRAMVPASEANPTATHAPDPDATLLRPEEQQARLAALAGGVSVPGFQIESTLGRGGMGVVYKAKQDGFKRDVAIKMLLAGQYADPKLRARFLLEAESIAALEHPGVVKVFAFGEHGGHPYLAMEYLPGGTLAERIKKGGPLPAKEATELVAKLAEAVAHAHSRGVVHRDIKPLNVLLTAEGEPRLSDFGLAKVGRADQNLSVSGQVLGTPAYMAPEQAAGKVHEVGTAADVYALGAVLYDVLTGRPPFQGDSAAVTLQKVLTEEPERPRKHNPSIPHDLETICLKCLEKVPTKRYPTAQALADDLLRYLRGEPITVRPAGTLERGYKWVKRNKVVSGAAATVFLALTVGLGLSVAFGLHANDMAEEAQRKQRAADEAAEREEKEKLAAINARNELKKSNDDLLREREQRNRTLARALVAPLRADKRGESFSPYEWHSLWEVALLRRDEVSWMFLEGAIQTPLTCKQLANRAEHVLHSAIGLDAQRRNAADRLLLRMLSEERTSPKALALALTVSRWGDASPELAAKTANVLADALAKEPSAHFRAGLAGALSAVSMRVESPESAKVSAQVAQVLLAALAKRADSSVSRDLIRALSLVATRMESPEVTKAAHVLLTALTKETNPDFLGDLVRALSALMARMESAEAAKVSVQAANVLLAALTNESDTHVRPDLADALSVVATRMEPAEAAKATHVLLAALLKETHPYVRPVLVRALSGMAVRLEPAEAAKATHVLLTALAKEPKLTALDKIPPSYARRDLVDALSVVAVRLDSAEAAKVSAQATNVLLTALAKEIDPQARRDLAEALYPVAVWLEPAEAAKAANVLLATLAKETGDPARRRLVRALSVVAVRLEPAEAAKAAYVLLAALAKETNPDARSQLVEELSVVAVRMEAAEAGNVPTALAFELPSPLCLDLANTLSAMILRMESAEAAKVSAQATNVLLTALAKETKSDARRDLAEALSLVVTWLEPAEAAKAADGLLAALAKETQSDTRRDLANALSGMTARMESTKAAKVSAQAADVLTPALIKETDPIARRRLAAALSLVVARLEPVEATKTADGLLAALLKDVASSVRHDLAEAWSAVAMRMEPVEVTKVSAQVADVLLIVFAENQSNSNREKVVETLSRVLLGMSPSDRDQRVTFHTTALFVTARSCVPSPPLLPMYYSKQPRLTVRELVELLKHPFCVGEARRAVLDALEFTCKRPFEDLWDFVGYAQKNHPELDLLTPPKETKLKIQGTPLFDFSDDPITL